MLTFLSYLSGDWHLLPRAFNSVLLKILFPSAGLHGLTLARGSEFGYMGPHREGAPDATLISGVIEPSVVSLVEGGMTIFTPS